MALDKPDKLGETIKGRNNALHIIGGSSLKITYKQEEGALNVITAIIKGE
ncbi:MAG: hypothetical protein H8D67_19315 [Deltaproteobacteria bacterium]|nr:hypothetical protein [Deltaproteobacteria bacterium]